LREKKGEKEKDNSRFACGGYLSLEKEEKSIRDIFKAFTEGRGERKASCWSLRKYEL